MGDTSRDYRILMALYAVSILESRIRQWGMPWPIKKQAALQLVADARKHLLRARYSFLPPRMLADSEYVASIGRIAEELISALIPEQRPRLERGQALAFAEIRWALSILKGLRRRLLLGDDNRPEYAVDVIGVEVTRVEPIKGTRLYATRASAGPVAFTIVTNIAGIKPGEVRAAAVLPPQEFSGVVSEAMYASDVLDRSYIGKRVPPQLLSGEVAAIVRRVTEGR
jgi:predicted RNA-binding protein with EMAP domain